MRPIRIILSAGLFVFCVFAPAYSETVLLSNGDQLKGKIERETTESLFVRHEILGLLEIKKDRISAVKAKPKEKGDLILERKAGVNYDLSKGNTDTQSVGGDFLLNRNRLWIDEWTLKGSALKQFSGKKSITQRWDASLRYAYTFWEKYYNFYRLSTEHDYYEGIKLRLTPTTGVGYWFSDTEALKLMTELGLGYEEEFYRPSGRAGKPILHARAFASKKIGERTEVGTDFYFFPSLRDFADYRSELEAFLKIKISESLGFKLQLKDQYKSRSRNKAKKNDLQLLSGLEYSF